MNELRKYLEEEIRKANAQLNSGNLGEKEKYAVTYHLMRCEDALVIMSERR